MILYLDTSSLVKLYLTEEGSVAVHALVDEADTVCTSVVAYPEARSAFARLHREGLLTTDQLRSVRSTFDRDWGTILKIRVLRRVYERAGRLAEELALRGFDSIHLASLFEIRQQAQGETVRFSAFDARLNAAAAATESS